MKKQKSEEREKFKSILLKTFREFDNFCKENSLSYCLAGGSLIGAIRHKGLIPWDDDIDVYMTLDNYQRFLDLKNKINIPYRINDMRDKGYFKPFAKFCDANTTIVQGEDIPFVYGVFIDIFPLYDGTTEDYKELHPKFHEYSWKYEMGTRKEPWRNLFSTLKTKGMKCMLGKLKYKIVYHFLRPYYLHKFKQVEKECRRRKGNCYIAYCGIYDNECYPKKWFSSMVEKTFENQTCLVPCNYHEYLTHVYGDYMTPPPVEVQQQPTHPYWYMNLDKYMTLDEVKTEMKNRR